MKLSSKKVALSLTLISALISGHSVAATVNLTNKGYVTYGDANSYSLPLNGLEVKSGPGQIALFTKLGLGAEWVMGFAAKQLEYHVEFQLEFDGFFLCQQRNGQRRQPGGMGSC